MPELGSDVEFICENEGYTPIIIDYLIISPITTECDISIHNAGEKNVRNRIYEVEDAYRDFKSYIITDEECIVSWRYIQMKPRGSLTINEMSMAAGTNTISLSGENISSAQIEIYDSEGNLLDMVIKNDQTSDYVEFLVESTETINIVLRNNTDFIINFSQLEIHWNENVS